MKRVCLVSFCNMYYLPYASLYIDSIIANGAKCSLLFWDRDAVGGNNDNYPQCDEKIVFQYHEIKNSLGLKKIWGYIKAARYFRKVLSEKDFSGLIFLQTHCAVACEKILLNKYRKKFILDIRDYFYDDIKWYNRKEKHLIDNSYANVISSPAYKTFLPEGKFYISHNYTPFNKTDLISFISKKQIKQSSSITISYVGTVRFIEMDKKMLNLFANDKRFTISYYGRGSEVLSDYCSKNHIENVKFHGSFSPTEILHFYEETDIINNIYGNHTKELDFALSNKIYHAGQLLTPILVCPDTYMETVSMKYKMGFVFDVNKEGIVDELYNWYNTFDREQFIKGCKRFIEDVIMENKEYINVCNDFVMNCNDK